MAKKYDVVAITGTYQKDGQDKARYQNVGFVGEKDGKFYLKLNQAVVFHDDGHVIQWFSLFAPKGQQQPAPQSAPQPATQSQDFDDDIPF